VVDIGKTITMVFPPRTWICNSILLRPLDLTLGLPVRNDLFHEQI
jgi:hypothetical protein